MQRAWAWPAQEFQFLNHNTSSRVVPASNLLLTMIAVGPASADEHVQGRLTRAWARPWHAGAF
jgi:hypothetical protein